MPTQQHPVDVEKIVATVNTTDDPRQALAHVREMCREAKENGEELPEVITKLERQLTQECIAESQGR